MTAASSSQPDNRRCPRCYSHYLVRGNENMYCGTCGFYPIPFSENDISNYKKPASSSQPNPTGEGRVILDLVLADLRERAEAGRERYGTYLRADNGRDALVDAYQEALDLCMYLRQEIEERNATNK